MKTQLKVIQGGSQTEKSLVKELFKPGNSDKNNLKKLEKKLSHRAKLVVKISE